VELSVFNELRKLVYKQSGIALSEKKLVLMKARINKRLRTLGISSYRKYLEILKADKSENEMMNFLDVISTNTTSFFREQLHFEIFSEFLKEALRHGQKRFRVWCAAASSGEEPYTLAMTIEEAINSWAGPRPDFRILATDISMRMLLKAREGIYTSETAKHIPLKLLERYFEKFEDKGKTNYKALHDIRKLILFKRLNLAEAPYPMKGPMDIIFCRNVMIYFDKPMRKKVLTEAYRLLKHGGLLMVGHAESLAGSGAGFKSLRPSVYVKD